MFVFLLGTCGAHLEALCQVTEAARRESNLKPMLGSLQYTSVRGTFLVAVSIASASDYDAPSTHRVKHVGSNRVYASPPGLVGRCLSRVTI